METENTALSLDTYSRCDLVNFKNVVDLDTGNSDDSTVYLGIDYSFASSLEFKNGGPKYYLKLERNGPGDYNAPLFVHNTLMTTGGVIEEYRNDELLPQAEEFWLDMPLRNNYRFKLGLYAYEVGEGFSLNGAYENYGFTFYKEWPNALLKFYYCRPDVVYKNHLGPRIRQDEEQGYVYNPNAANFFATDVKIKWDESYFHPYLGVLADYTSEGKRDNLFTAPIKKDILGTLGFACSLRRQKLSLTTEIAHNFGKAESASSDYKDIYHTGYMLYTDVAYGLEKFTPRFKFLLASGNKVDLDMVQNQDATLTSGKNRAFSPSSPLNMNLSDSIGNCHSEIRPLVAMGSCYGLSYGVPRPNTFYATDFDNLIITALGFEFKATGKLNIIFDGLYLESLERGAGMLDGEAKYLSRGLGYEFDLIAEYQLNDNLLLSASGGYFVPGRYYKEKRDDTDGSLFNPYLRGDGHVNPAYQIEMSLELKF
ncbi:MAG: hypothetical protein V1884_00805 [Candidatus Omnitrophota bacterium]